MVEVATGGDDATEQLPMVLKVPHLSSDPLVSICNNSPGVMLGFGDILVPGLLVSFCHAYDLQKGSRFWTYWLLTNVFYALGMIATFISLFVMDMAQPALLYLVPFTLIPIFIVAFAKGDLQTMWQGDFHVSDDLTKHVFFLSFFFNAPFYLTNVCCVIDVLTHSRF